MEETSGDSGNVCLETEKWLVGDQVVESKLRIVRVMLQQLVLQNEDFA